MHCRQLHSLFRPEHLVFYMDKNNNLSQHFSCTSKPHLLPELNKGSPAPQVQNILKYQVSWFIFNSNEKSKTLNTMSWKIVGIYWFSFLHISQFIDFLNQLLTDATALFWRYLPIFLSKQKSEKTQNSKNTP